MHGLLHAHDTETQDSPSFCTEKNAVCATSFNEREERLDGMFSLDFHLLFPAQVVVGVVEVEVYEEEVMEDMKVEVEEVEETIPHLCFYFFVFSLLSADPATH